MKKGYKYIATSKEDLSFCSDELINFLDIMFGGDEYDVIYSHESNIIKIPRYLRDKIQATAEQVEGFSFVGVDLTGGKLLHHNKIVALLGNGSVGRISTEEQEQGTVDCWNRLIELYKDGIDDVDEAVDKTIAYANSREGKTKIGKDWIASFKHQLAAIKTYLGADWYMYKALRWGHDHAITRSLVELNNSVRADLQATGVGKFNKDGIDPSDIILYKSTVRGMSADNIDEYRDNYFIPKKIVGVSLKKLNGASNHITTYNTGKGNLSKVKKVEWVETKRRSAVVNVIVVGGLGEVYGQGEIDQDNTFQIELRSFGSGQAAVEVRLGVKGGVAIGKCPVEIWTQRDKNKRSVDEWIEWFKATYNTDDEGLANIIRGAVKEGHYCFPFVLIK